MKPVYEDNHIIIVNKAAGEIVQADKTGDRCLIDDVRDYLRGKYSKPGNVFVVPVHRLDRPTTGLVIFAKTDKGLSRFSECFRKNSISKTYLAITDGLLDSEEGELSDYLVKDEEQNRSYVVGPNHPDAKLGRLGYKHLADSDRYHLYRVDLMTGRHHQIRSQFAERGVHIKGDVKYGARRANDDKSISLHAFSLQFKHPIGGRDICVRDWPDSSPEDRIWSFFKSALSGDSKYESTPIELREVPGTAS